MEKETATVLVVVHDRFYKYDVAIDGEIVPKGDSIEANLVKFSLPSRGRMRSHAEGMFRLTAGETYVLLHESYNASSSVYVESLEGLEEIFAYGDGHGMRWAALYKVLGASWKIDWASPAHHGHGVHLHRASGTRDAFERQDAAREFEKAKQV